MPSRILASHRMQCVSPYSGRQRQAAEIAYDSAVEFYKSNYAKCAGPVAVWTRPQFQQAATVYAQQRCKCIMGLVGYLVLQAIISYIIERIVEAAIQHLFSNPQVACMVIGEAS